MLTGNMLKDMGDGWGSERWESLGREVERLAAPSPLSSGTTARLLATMKQDYKTQGFL